MTHNSKIRAGRDSPPEKLKTALIDETVARMRNPAARSRRCLVHSLVCLLAACDTSMVVDDASVDVLADVNYDFNASCPLASLNVETAQLTGVLTLNGGPWPASGFHNADTLYFVDRATDSSFTAALDDSGGFAGTIIVGDYELVLSRGSHDAGIVLRSVSAADLGPSTRLDLDLQPVPTTGRVTFNGGSWPLTGQFVVRTVEFTDTETRRSFTAQVAEDGSFDTALVAGTYDVAFVGGQTDVNNARQSALLQRSVDVSAPGPLVFDVQTVNVSGQVTINGEPWPTDDLNGTEEPNEISFFNEELGRGFSIALSSIGAFQTALVVAEYNVGLVAWRNPIPRQVAQLRREFVPTSDFSSFDVELTEVAGTVSLNGGPWPVGGVTGSDRSASVEFLSGRVSMEVGPGGEIGGPMISGTYDPYLVVRTPRGTRRVSLGQGIRVGPEAPLSLHAETSSLRGQITLNGAPWPSGGLFGSGGGAFLQLWHRYYGAEGTLVSLGLATMTGTEIQGGPFLVDTYELQLLANHSQTLNNPQTVVFREDWVLDSEPFTWALEAVELGGRLTLNGEPWPDGGVSGSDLTNELRFVQSGTSQSFGVPVDEGSFSTPLFTGTYDLVIQANDHGRRNGLRPFQLVRIVEGCQITP